MNRIDFGPSVPVGDYLAALEADRARAGDMTAVLRPPANAKVARAAIREVHRAAVRDA